jgi:hypothetical protein
MYKMYLLNDLAFLKNIYAGGEQTTMKYCIISQKVGFLPSFLLLQ